MTWMDVVPGDMLVDAQDLDCRLHLWLVLQIASREVTIVQVVGMAPGRHEKIQRDRTKLADCSWYQIWRRP